MSDAERPTERIDPPPPPPSAVNGPPRALLYALLGVGIAILAALVVIIVIILVPRPGEPASVSLPPPEPSATPVPTVSATAPPTEDDPEPGFTTLNVATADRDGMSIEDACETLRSEAKKNDDGLEITITWESEGVEYVEGRLERSTPSDWSDLEANSTVSLELDCFTKSGDLSGTNVELRAYDADGDEVDVITFRVFGNGDVADIG